MSLRLSRLCKLFFCLLLLYFCFFLIKNTTEAVQSCKNAIFLCLERVLPSLLPFCIINNIIINTGIAEKIGQKASKIFTYLFCLPGEASICFILGCISGFPMGAQSAVSLYEKKLISSSDAEKIICFCNNTGPAFVISFCGTCLGNTLFGWMIYFSQIFSAIIIALLIRKRSEKTRSQLTKNSITISGSIISDSIKQCILPLLSICVFVTFFSVIGASLDNLLSLMNTNDVTKTFFKGILEISSGVDSVKNISYMPLKIILTALFVGWSGISVHFQTASICTPYGIKTGKYLIFKALQSLICALFSFILYLFVVNILKISL